ncbi:Oligopeptidase A [Mannheimia haemolytica]|uniref:Oligopeptidase A n=1 Tax=Mannheimia haemolytica TaxID=75985 RepID=A0A378N3H9_MANHA|nr:Oligopeptidase A [Mannheimia haemolytica]
MIKECRETVEKVAQIENPTWENFYMPQAMAGINSPVRVTGRAFECGEKFPELREAYQACLPLLSEYSTWRGNIKGYIKAM